jgi:hypothetical protein
LQILIAFINPQPKQSKEQKGNKHNIIGTYDDSSSSSSSSDSPSAEAQQPQSSRRNSEKRPPIKMLKIDQQNEKDQQIPMAEEFVDLLYEFSIFTTLNAYLINDSGIYSSGQNSGYKNLLAKLVRDLSKTKRLKLNNSLAI